MNESYVPDEGDIVWIDFIPQAGHEQAGRRPGFVITPESYNKIGLALVCPITNQKKGYPFEVEIPSFGRKATGVILADHVKSLDWKARNAVLKEKTFQELLDGVKGKLALLLQI